MNWYDDHDLSDFGLDDEVNEDGGDLLDGVESDEFDGDLGLDDVSEVGDVH